MSKLHNRGMWAYLESIDGLLERGDDLAIKEAKKAYRKQYLLKYKKQQRISKPEFIVSFSNSNGDLGRLQNASKRHNRAITAFIREATMCYISKVYLVPDKQALAHIELLLSENLNVIQQILKQKTNFRFEWDQKYEAIELQIAKLEKEITEVFTRPAPIEQYVKKAITADPTLREQILNIITTSNDIEDINAQKDFVRPTIN